ncbi:MAG: HAD-IIIA family hydrolase [Bacilli bacterium]|nr:HAD-IIIA family hydrolase [Bacilli bacterium]
MNAFIYYRNPKAALEVIHGEKLVRHQVRNLLETGADKIGICCEKGSEFDAICAEFAGNAQIIAVSSECDLGTGGYLYIASQLFDSGYIYIDGSSYFEIAFSRFEKFHEEHEGALTVFLQNAIDETAPAFGISESGKVTRIDFGGGEGYFRSPTRFKGIAYVGETLASTFVGDPEPLDLMTEIIHPTFATGNCYGYRSTEFVEDVYANPRLEELVEKGLPAQRRLDRKQKCIFLDRDGVLNVFGPFVVEPSILKLKDDVVEAVKLINESGYLAVVTTNQPVIAFGETDLLTLEQVHFKLHSLLNKEGAILDDLYFCPHFPYARGEHSNMDFVKVCDCRKPGTGMLKKAAERYNIDFGSSWMVGDTTQDVQTGINAGVKTVLVTTGDPNPRKKFGDAKPDYICENLLDAVKNVILK